MKRLDSGFEEEKGAERGSGKGERKRKMKEGERREGRGVYCLDWTKNTRYTNWVIKWVIVCIAAFRCAS